MGPLKERTRSPRCGPPSRLCGSVSVTTYRLAWFTRTFPGTTLAACSIRWRMTPKAIFGLKTPLISECAEDLGEDRLAGQHEAELFDEWPQSDCGHVGDEFVEHAALTED